MNLSISAKRLLAQVTAGTFLLGAALTLILSLASFLGLGNGSVLSIALGAFSGCAVAVLNFILLCLTVTFAARRERGKQAFVFQLSYILRLLLLAGWITAACALPRIPFLAAALPVLFPQGLLMIFGRSTDQPSDVSPGDLS